MVPTRTGKPGKKIEHFPVGEKGILLRLEKSGNFTQNTGKIRKKILENCQAVTVKTLQIWYHTLNEKKNFKKYWKTVKNCGKSGKFVRLKKWELWHL